MAGVLGVAGRRAAWAATLVLVGLWSACARAQQPQLNPFALSELNCFNPAAPNADYEAYGPTDVDAQAGNGTLTIGENAAGTLTVFKYPNPSFYNQVKYLATHRDARGVPVAQYPNEGSFAGLRYTTASGTGFAWLRDWPATQAYDSPDSAVPLTVYHSPATLGLTISDFDLAPDGARAFEREFWVTRAPGSPVRDATLVYYENFNPTATRLEYLPIADWCLSQTSDGVLTYDPRAGALVNSWSGTDFASGTPASVAIAFGWDARDDAHQAGRDGYDPAAQPAGPDDPYIELASRPYALGGATAASGQTAGALAVPLRFDGAGRAAERLTIAAGADADAALAGLAAARSRPFAAALAHAAADWRGWLAGTQLPASADPRVLAIAKRSLITIRLAVVPGSGAIVASADTQGPYGEDWIRDGSFINAALDLNGKTDTVTAHDLFYARVQTQPGNASVLRPPGNWAMTSYGDGIDGGPIPYEIDETGLGTWALWAHVAYLHGRARAAYLDAVYPAIARAANYMTLCADPLTGLQCEANEDDNYLPSESLHGAIAVWLGLRSAIAAAAAVGDRSTQVGTWQARFTRLDAAIVGLYDGHAYGEGNAAGNAYNVDYGDGGWVLWPAQFRPYSDPTMRNEASAVAAAMNASFASAQGEYEAKALLGLAYSWSHPSAAQAAELRRVLGYMAANLTTSTGLFGEAWERLVANRPQPVEDMPHVWEHTLFYLAALRIDGERPYTFAPADAFAADCATSTAPAGVCPAAGAAPRGRCRATLRLRIAQRRGRVVRVDVFLGRRLLGTRRGREITRLQLRRPRVGAFTLRLVERTASGRRLVLRRRYPACSAR